MWLLFQKMSLGSKEIMLRIKASTTVQPLFPAQMNFTLSTFMIIMLNAAKAQVPFPPRKMFFFFFNGYTHVSGQLNKRLFNYATWHTFNLLLYFILDLLNSFSHTIGQQIGMVCFPMKALKNTSRKYRFILKV